MSSLYKKICVGSRKVDEHRYKMEQLLGRKLLPGEIVHHKDGNTRNNDPSNLEIVTRSVHAKIHGWQPKVPYDRLVEMGKWLNAHYNSRKLTEAQVMEIRERLASGAGVRATARQYGVDHTTIIRLRDGKTWRGVGMRKTA